MMLERWTFNVVLVYLSVVYWAFLLFTLEPWVIVYIAMVFYVIYAICDMAQVLMLLFYSQHPQTRPQARVDHALDADLLRLPKDRDADRHYRRVVFRKSFESNFVPERVRNATWHW